MNAATVELSNFACLFQKLFSKSLIYKGRPIPYTITQVQ